MVDTLGGRGEGEIDMVDTLDMLVSRFFHILYIKSDGSFFESSQGFFRRVLHFRICPSIGVDIKKGPTKRRIRHVCEKILIGSLFFSVQSNQINCPYVIIAVCQPQ